MTDLLTSRETAQMLGITENNLRQLVFKKRITPAARKGRTNYFHPLDIESFATTRAKVASVVGSTPPTGATPTDPTTT